MGIIVWKISDIDINSLPQIIFSPFTIIQTQEVTLTTQNIAYALPSNPLTDRLMLVIYNNSGSTIYWGGSNVTTSNGIPILDTKHVVIGASAGVYAVCGSAGKTLRIAEVK